MKPKKENIRKTLNYKALFLDDCDCRHCKYYQGRKRGCKLENCCCDDEKLEAISAGRHKRKKGAQSWDS